MTQLNISHRILSHNTPPSQSCLSLLFFHHSISQAPLLLSGSITHSLPHTQLLPWEKWSSCFYSSYPRNASLKPSVGLRLFAKGHTHAMSKLMEELELYKYLSVTQNLYDWLPTIRFMFTFCVARVNCKLG